MHVTQFLLLSILSLFDHTLPCDCGGCGIKILKCLVSTNPVKSTQEMTISFGPTPITRGSAM